MRISIPTLLLAVLSLNLASLLAQEPPPVPAKAALEPVTAGPTGGERAFPRAK
jgi:hypothetical protein